MTARGLLIGANNWLVRRVCRRVPPAHLLVLLPRCLQRAGCGLGVVEDLDACRQCGQCDVAALLRLRNETGVRCRMAGGGRVAAEWARQPDVLAIVACACEKELLEGIRAAFPKPVFGVTQENPEGFCHNSRVDRDRLREAICARIVLPPAGCSTQPIPRRSSVRVWLIVAMAVVVGGGAVWLTVRHVIRAPSATAVATPEDSPSTNRFSRTVAADVKLYGPGAGAFPQIAVGLCRVVKPRVGGFRLGVGSILEIDRLEINLPIDAQAVVAMTPENGMPTNRPTDMAWSMDQILRQSADLAALRRLSGIATPLSGVNLHDLRVSMVRGKDRIVVLTAASGHVAGKGLALKNCVFFDEQQRSITAAEAQLVNQNGWRIVAENGAPVEIEKVAGALRRTLP